MEVNSTEQRWNKWASHLPARASHHWQVTTAQLNLCHQHHYHHHHHHLPLRQCSEWNHAPWCILPIIKILAGTSVLGIPPCIPAEVVFAGEIITALVRVSDLSTTETVLFISSLLSWAISLHPLIQVVWTLEGSASVPPLPRDTFKAIFTWQFIYCQKSTCCGHVLWNSLDSLYLTCFSNWLVRTAVWSHCPAASHG